MRDLVLDKCFRVLTAQDVEDIRNLYIPKNPPPPSPWAVPQYGPSNARDIPFGAPGPSVKAGDLLEMYCPNWFRGVHKDKNAKAKPWRAYIDITEKGKRRQIHIGSFAREEDAVRAYDRVSIAYWGPEAKTNLPVAGYRAEWAELEALGVYGAVALERGHAEAEHPDEE